MYYRVSIETVTRGHYVYKQSRKPELNQVLHCKEDKRAEFEAKEYDNNVIGVYVTPERPDAGNNLASHVPIQLSRLLTFFLQANADNLLTATVTEMRKREVGLVVPAKLIAFTQELKNAKILKRELEKRASRYAHFELKKTLLLRKINSHRDLLIVLPMCEPSIFRGVAVSILRPVIGSNVEIDVVALNRPYSYSQYWTGTSLQWRLTRGNRFKCK